MNKVKLVIILFLLSYCAVYGQTAQQGCEIRGKVICNGKGLANVVVSDGIRCVITNQKGEYVIPSLLESRFVYISTPAGYVTDRKEKTIPLFYQAIEANKNEYNFEIKRNSKDDTNHVFIAQADVQLPDIECLDKYKEIVKDCKQLVDTYSNKDIFGVDCGDIVGDAPSLFPEYIEAASALDFPIYRAIGNHDMDYYGRTHETSTRTFENYFGPTRYSFNKGNAHYIIVNNSFFIGRDYFYMGYIDEKTFAWLEQDLSYVKEGTPVFFVMHIPSQLEEKKNAFQYKSDIIASQTINASALHNLLKPYNTHIITGHMHFNHNVVYAPNLMEHNTGAVCGTWWRGEICLDGTPQGYGVYEVNGNDVKWYYKSSGFPIEHQFRAYKTGSSKEYPNDIIVNVWNWDKQWKVEWLEDGIVKGDMTHFTGVDPDAEILCADKEKIKYDWISAITTEHLFRVTPDNPKAKLSIRVTDRFGKVYQENI